MVQYVYRLGGAGRDTPTACKEQLGGKGANLAEMADIGLPVPPGFTIVTDICSLFHAAGRTFPDQLAYQVSGALAHIESSTGRRFGDARNPLLVSVRSGARVSMPGMMDTVLNLGLNDATVKGLAATSGDDRFAWDSYRRFIQMYADVVLGLDRDGFEDALDSLKDRRGICLDTDVTAQDWKELVGTYQALVLSRSGKPFPQDVEDQLWGAIAAVFRSWECERARVYRRLNDIPVAWGTAVTVQAMVFGNMGPDSATGVAFTRDPSTGERILFGEYLINAQGEDVVAGIRTPQHLTCSARERAGARAPSLEEAMPDSYAELCGILARLETHYRDMQDVEFTIEQGRLWILQTRAGKRSAAAAVRIAVELANEGLIRREEAVCRVDPSSLEQLLHPTLDPAADRKVIGKGLPASPGAASGVVVFDSESAERLAAQGKDVILVRAETSPEDIHGMQAAKGILTATGGMTSHAAVVARGMGRPCVCGVGALTIDRKRRSMRLGPVEIAEGEEITVDGLSGECMLGIVPTIRPDFGSHFATLMEWADSFRRLRVRANAETPLDCRTARSLGAEGIGLCRTEHMFFSEERIAAVRRMILAESEEERRLALAWLLPEQRKDFAAIFEAMRGLPVTIRLLDPPLHEFLPREDSEIEEVAAAVSLGADAVKRRAMALQEFNPMLGHRGCRLGITFPEIYEMQARAIFEAALEVDERPLLEIMIPLIGSRRELEVTKATVDAVAQAIMEERGARVIYQIGTMIELPRAALMAGEIAQAASFFSFGTNDLTQTTLGISRDDSARFMTSYLDKGIFQHDPFQSLDVEGVGQLISLAVERGRRVNPDMKLGICGEHGGDPRSIAFCESEKFDYVSSSPYRIPVARLAAARAAIASKSAL